MSGKVFGGDSQRGQTDGQIDCLVSDRYLDEMPTLWLVLKKTVGWDKGIKPNKNICVAWSNDDRVCYKIS